MLKFYLPYELDQSKKSIIEKQISKKTGREKILLFDQC